MHLTSSVFTPSIIHSATGSGSEKIRTAVLFQRFGPYHHARLNAAGRRLALWGLEACGEEDIYAWDKVEGADSFRRRTLTDRNRGNRQWRQELHQKMWRNLQEIQPQVVVLPGWASIDAFSALAWCIQSGTPAIMMSESTFWDEPRSLWKEWVKSRLVNLCVAGFAGGTPQADYLVTLGLPREKVFLGYDTVDNHYFHHKTDEVRASASSLRQSSGLPEKYFLASARFVEKKNLAGLIRAFAQYRQRAQKAGRAEIWDLVLLGDGALKTSLTQLISELGLAAYVCLPGFKQYHELPLYLGLASAFVHASTTEQWGLVVNEAMASGLPVLVSNRCGCAADLVTENTNGFTFAPDNVDDFAQRMFSLSAPEFPLTDFGAASRRIISQWGPERFAQGLHDAVTAARNSPPRHAGWLDRSLLNLLLRR